MYLPCVNLFTSAVLRVGFGIGPNPNHSRSTTLFLLFVLVPIVGSPNSCWRRVSPPARKSSASRRRPRARAPWRRRRRRRGGGERLSGSRARRSPNGRRWRRGHRWHSSSPRRIKYVLPLCGGYIFAKNRRHLLITIIYKMGSVRFTLEYF